MKRTYKSLTDCCATLTDAGYPIVSREAIKDLDSDEVVVTELHLSNGLTVRHSPDFMIVLKNGPRLYASATTTSLKGLLQRVKELSS